MNGSCTPEMPTGYHLYRRKGEPFFEEQPVTRGSFRGVSVLQHFFMN